MSAALDVLLASREAQRAAACWRIGGRVQGVGFRPFVYRYALGLGLSGWVRNCGGEVEIHAEGTPQRLRAFGDALLSRAPPAAAPQLVELRAVPLERGDRFLILPSTSNEVLKVHVPADLFTCDDCLAELADPTARRHRYPFINCTQCGPRYTLIRAMPYDRPNTTLDGFALCPECAAEYADPLDRRFHAQPLACPACGPALHWRTAGSCIDGNEPALAAAVAALRDGQIVAVRGVGGYHLMCDAADEHAVVRLRARKGRPAKPLAVMVPWCGPDGLDYARSVVRLTALEAASLLDNTRPILLAERAQRERLAASIAPGSSDIGVMLPYSPLHHLILADFGAALVATSGNVSGEPVLTLPEDAEARLAHVADGFLHHDRPIARPADDPVVRVIADIVRPLRLGRGTAPLELRLPWQTAVPTLAVGAYSKSTVALAWEDRAVISPHIGELGSPRGREVFAQVAQDLQRLYGVRAQRIAHDAHPGFPATRWAREAGLPVHLVWHHHAHAAAVAGEYPSEAPLLCFTWDGLGLGPDGTLWGGEALLGRPGAWKRVASWRPFRLPGGERAAREPWRSALALSWESGSGGSCPGQPQGEPLLRAAWDRGLNSPTTSSIGRLFDAAAALLGVCRHASHEGEAGMRLEALCNTASSTKSAEPVIVPLIQDGGIWRSDWAALLPALMDTQADPAVRARTFHMSLAHALCAQAIAVRRESGVARVGLSGGVFQNRTLCEYARALLSAAGFEVLIPRRLPVNDAAISFGQLIESLAICGE
jgi:hydrogenase maturation protein HypF